MPPDDNRISLLLLVAQLCPLRRLAEIQLNKAMFRISAGIALKTETTLTPEQQETLHRMSTGELGYGDRQVDHDVQNMLWKHSGLSKDKLSDEITRRDTHVSAWKAVARYLAARFTTTERDEYSDDDPFEDCLEAYAWDIANGQKEPDWFSTQMAQLDRDGHGNLIASMLVQKFPLVAEEMPLLVCGAAGRDGAGATPITPTDLIRRSVVTSRYHVSPSTLQRAIGKSIHTYRAPNGPKNTAHLYSEAEIAAQFPRHK